VRPADEPVSLSASALEALLVCPAQWFLRREAGGEVLNTASQAFGTLVHAIAQRVATGELEVTDVDADLMPLVDKVWERLSFRTPWAEAREREAIRAVLDRFLHWHRRPGARTVVRVEAELSAEVDLPGGERVRLTGFADRLELDEDGRVVVVDFKTGKYLPTVAEVAEHPQLGLYQLAVDAGAVDDLLGRPGTAGGAELVQLRAGGEMPKVQAQAAAGEYRPVLDQLALAVTAIREEEFVARPGKQCERCTFTALCPAFTAGSVLA
jgi:RecB family exonuclease